MIFGGDLNVETASSGDVCSHLYSFMRDLKLMFVDDRIMSGACCMSGHFAVSHNLLHNVCDVSIVRSTRPSGPNKVALKCPSARRSTKRLFDFSDIWYVGRGRRLMHDGMQYDPIQGQGHEPLKVGNSAIFKGYLLPHL